MMLNDAWFLTVMRAQIEADKRLLRPATLSTDHALRLLEMAERWHADTATKPLRSAPMTAELRARLDEVPHA